MSASTIKIMEPGASGVGPNGAPGGSEGERLVVITGQPANIQMAVQLLYHVSFKSVSLLIFIHKISQRLEQEKQKQLRAQQQSSTSSSG